MSDDKYEHARNLAEEALAALDEGDEAKADRLIAEAKKRGAGRGCRVQPGCGQARRRLGKLPQVCLGP